MRAVESKAGPRFGASQVKNWSKLKLKPGPRFSLLIFPVWGMFYITHSAWGGGVQNSLGGNCKDIKKEVFEKTMASTVFVFLW